MPEETDPSSKIFAQSLAIRLGLALLLGYAIVTGFAIHDKMRLKSIEKVTAPTAVGDKALFPPPASFDPSVPLVNFEGHSLYFVEWQQYLDTIMTRIGMDDTNSYAVYKLDGAKGDDASALYLKIKQGNYVKLKRQ